MKSCRSSSNRIHLVAGTETRALSLCRKITNFGAYPSCLWVRGTAHNPLITAQNKSESTVQLVLYRKDSSILPLIQSSLLTWWKSTRQTVSHPRTQNQSWQQVAVYGMYLYELWNLGVLQVVFLAPRSLSEQSSRNSGPVSERAAVWKAKNLTLRCMCTSVCSGQERVLQEISSVELISNSVVQ